MKEKNKVHISALRAAFPHTLPIMAGFLFLGASYGVLMASRGFSFWYPLLTSTVVFAGSMEFTLAGLLMGAFAPFEAVLLALMINARHIFYGISMLPKYRGLGRKKIYMIFALCDETFSVVYSATAPTGVDDGWFRFYISLLNHSYWIAGATLGGIFGSLLPLDIKGIDFAMTALFVVILIEQIISGVENLTSVLTGLSFSALSLFIFGASDFIIPSMAMMLLILTLLRRPIEALYTRRGEDVS